MDSVGLPVELQLKIFKELDWKDINNLKLVCKDFYFTVVKNIEKLDRPKLTIIQYTLEITEEVEIPQRVEFDDDRDYEIFLKDKDFTEIKKLAFKNVTSRETIDVETGYNVDDSYGDYCFFVIRLSNRTPEYFKIYIQKTSDLHGIPYDVIFLKKESLRKMGLFERDGPSLIMKKITMDIIVGYPMSENGNTSTDTTEPLFDQIMDYVCENRCEIKTIEIGIRQNRGFNVITRKFYRNMFEEARYDGYEWIRENSRQFEREVYIECPNCFSIHENYICIWRDVFQGVINVTLRS